MIHHLLHGAISVGSGGALTTIVSHAAAWTKRYRKLEDAISEAQDVGLMEHATRVGGRDLGMTHAIDLPEAFDVSKLDAAGFARRVRTQPAIPM